MSWLKRVLGLAAPKGADTAPAAGPLGLARGRAVRFDPSLGLLLEGHSRVCVPASQSIWSEGVIDLGQSHWLSRYYLDDQDFWLQVHTTGARDGQVESLILFNYLDCVGISSEAELRRLAGPDSPIGLPRYSLDGVEFAREWGSEAGQTKLVDFFERVRSMNDEAYGIGHYAMLYARDTGLTARREFLLFSVEEDAAGAVSLSTALGVSLYTTDLHLI
ncbi:DUF2491 family protein [Azotobacter salinestris]|uniref:DUF2491 family protein n=1 Tax=Azotobacter salinestris TaxID=69964 RepID=UPI001266AA2C|nr:DUF2491 family protein [Azotobacter salinestris]